MRVFVGPHHLRPSARNKFEAGTPPIVRRWPCAAIDYVNSIGRAPLRGHEKGLPVHTPRTAIAEDQFA